MFEVLEYLSSCQDSGVIAKGHCYVARYLKEQAWHRCRVYEISKENQLANVFFCDLGIMRQVSTSDLLELNPDFARVAACFFRAYLYDVLPTTGTLQWLKPATEYFRKLVLGKQVVGIVLAKSETPVRIGFPEAFPNIGVVLLGKRMVKGCRSSFRKSTINSQMVAKGFARAIGIL